MTLVLLEVYRNIFLPDLHRQLQEKNACTKVCNSQPYLLPFSKEEASILTQIRWFFRILAHCLLYLLAFAIPCPNFSCLDLLACHVASSTSLDSVTKLNPGLPVIKAWPELISLLHTLCSFIVKVSKILEIWEVNWRTHILFSIPLNSYNLFHLDDVFHTTKYFDRFFILPNI